jgi:hypothetical protein
MAKCIPIPKLPEPSLPSGLSFDPPALPLPTLPEGVCCKLPPLQPPALPIHIPPLTLAPVLAVLKAATAAINDVQKLIPLTCPRE